MKVHVAGTLGYLAPEYAHLGQLSDKVDVYSFGVLCLEIISGQKHIVETALIEQIYLPKWAWMPHEENRLLDIVDPELHVTDEELHDIQRVMKMCLLCIQTAPEKRPHIVRIVSILQSDTESEIVVLGDNKSELAYAQSARSSRSKSLEDNNTGLEMQTLGSKTANPRVLNPQPKFEHDRLHPYQDDSWAMLW